MTSRLYYCALERPSLGVGSDRDDADTVESRGPGSDQRASGVASNGRPDSIIHLCSSCIGFDLPVLAFSFIISGLKRVTNPKIASVQVDLRVISSRTQLTCFACFSSLFQYGLHLFDAVLVHVHSLHVFFCLRVSGGATVWFLSIWGRNVARLIF